MEGATDLQLEVLRAYTSLRMAREDWGGCLILNLGLDDGGAVHSRAANVAGAVCLSLEADGALGRAALRSGACDFAVNTLDEALRAMKNEVRQRRPLSVGLVGPMAQYLAEMVDRGVQPELCTGRAGQDEQDSVAVLAQRGMKAAVEAMDLSRWLAERGWQAVAISANTPADLREADERALAMVGAGDLVRRQWLQRVPRLLPREEAKRRVLWATAEEAKELAGLQKVMVGLL